jgi:hypothetical protein
MTTSYHLVLQVGRGVPKKKKKAMLLLGFPPLSSVYKAATTNNNNNNVPFFFSHLHMKGNHTQFIESLAGMA